jgi:hypothetical protein
MTPLSNVKTLITEFYHLAEMHDAINGADALIRFTLHSINLERLITLEYVERGRAGLIQYFPPRSSLKEKCDAVLEALEREGFADPAVSAERFARLMPAAGVAKHAIYPHFDDLELRIAWAREATLALFQHFFGESLPPNPYEEAA